MGFGKRNVLILAWFLYLVFTKKKKIGNKIVELHFFTTSSLFTLKIKTIAMPEKTSGIWDAIGPESIAYLQKNFTQKAPEIVEFLMMYLLSEEEIEISIYEEENVGKGSFVTYDPYSTDKQLSLKNMAKGSFELELFLYDHEDEEVLFTYLLTAEDKENIPKNLQAIMEQARAKMKATTVLSASL